jgi:uncharacterized protein YegP (UPF0339 family)
MKFEIYQADSQWRWRLKNNDGEVIAQGENHVNRTDCIKTINLVKGTNAATPVI